jgi:hypothetical protein
VSSPSNLIGFVTSDLWPLLLMGPLFGLTESLRHVSPALLVAACQCRKDSDEHYSGEQIATANAGWSSRSFSFALSPAWLRFPLGDKTASMTILKILGVGVGLVLGFFALLYLLFSLGLYLNEPGVSHRGLKCAFASIPFLITVGIVYGCFFMGDTSYSRALLYTALAEVCLFAAIAAFLLWWEAALQRSAPNKPAAGNAGVASRLTLQRHWPGVPEPGRSAE